ncbi:pikachurin-like [Saccostrea echinata]|uniref:pikachurin-like n=1 Tax=Saccostrea echinata TaxID=191078 RepID=UPI002A810C1A|nr:pikachurin-like [Saccostrea echinata]
MKALLTVLLLAILGVTTTLALTCCTCDDLEVTGTSSSPQILPCPFIIKVNKFAYKTNDPEEYLTVTLESRGGGRFINQFMLQAVSIDSMGKALVANPGENGFRAFTQIPVEGHTVSTTSDCEGKTVKSDTNLKFDSKATKIQFSFAPRRIQGPIKFRATFVDDQGNFWLREESEPIVQIGGPSLDPSIVRQNALPIIDPIHTDKCGIEKGCYRVPEGCWEPYCDYIATWRPLSRVGTEYMIEMSARVNGITDRHVSLALSEDIRWGDDRVFECVHEGGTGLTKVYQAKSIDHSTQRFKNPGDGIDDSCELYGLKCGGQFLEGRVRCRFVVRSSRTINSLPLSGSYHVLMYSGPAENTLTAPHRYGYGEYPVASPDMVSLADISINMQGFARYPLVKAHGILMILAWCFFGTVGLLMTKYYKPMWPNKRFYGQRYWFVAHFNCMAWLFIFVLIAFILIFVEAGGYSKVDYFPLDAHPVMGIIIFCCVIINPIIALLRPADDHDCRPCVNWVHWAFGTVAWCLAIPNMFIGMSFGKAHVPWWATWILFIYILFHIIVEITLEIHQCCTHKKNKGSPFGNAVHPKNTQLSSSVVQNHSLGSVQEEISVQNSFHGETNDNIVLGPSPLVMFPTCVGKVCKNFARCSIQDSQAKCYCPLGYTGKLCDTERIVKYPQFMGDSFLTLPPITSGYRDIEISVEFKPASDSGLLLFSSEHSQAKGDFFSLVLVNGFVEFRFDCGTGPAVIRSPNHVKIGQWNQVKAKRSESQGWLWMNGHGPVSGFSQGSYTRITLRTSLYVGGYQNISPIRSRVNMWSGFRGCVQSLVINQWQYDFRKSVRGEPKIAINNGRSALVTDVMGKLGDAIDGQNIEDCSKNVCDDNVCHNGGTCKIISPDQYVCLCPLGFYGPDCIQSGKVQVPEFKGHSVLQYQGLGRNSLSYTEIEMIIKPTVSEGVMLYNGYTNNRQGDYISVLMRQGYVEFQFDLGTGPAFIRSSKPLSLKKWHRVKVSRTGLQGVLEVDNQSPVQGLSKGAFTQLTLLQPLFIGGHPNFDITSKYLNMSTSFKGCIQKFIINDRPVDLVEEAAEGYNVEPCSHPCNTKPCQNSGLCVPKLGLYGCSCPIGFTDSHCERNLTIFTAKFRGSGFLSYDDKDIRKRVSGRKSNIHLKIRGHSLDGLLFWTSKTLPVKQEGEDFLALGFRNGSLLFHYNLGFGRALISYNRTLLSDGKWHSIKVQRNGQHGSLIVDDTHVVKGKSPGRFNDLNINGPVYIGGMPDVSYNTMSLYETGFVGCIRDVILSNDFPVKLMESATEGQRISQCAGY